MKPKGSPRFIASIMLSRAIPVFLGCMCVGIILIFTPVTKTLIKMLQIGRYTAQHFTQFQSDFRSHNSGLEVLPLQVREMLALLYTYDLKSYQLSQQLNQDAAIQQRITESAWPIRKEQTSLSQFRLISEIEKGNTCVEIDRRQEIALVHCP